MSYDIDLYRRGKPATGPCSHCGSDGAAVSSERVFGCEPTYNIGGIVRCADRHAFGSDGRSFGVIHRMTGLESLSWLRPVLVVLESTQHLEELLKLEPSNRCGSLEGTIRVFREIIEAAQANPTCLWCVCGDGDTDRTGNDSEFFGWGG